ncbi:MAG: DUF3784 domain-containing protein [Clostridiales bacterium]|nr:DUF3784 domain-containing protein [Clostridiales bacterium]
MKLADVSHGPDWIVWICFAVFVVLAIVLISGHGSGLIAGYNTASDEEKSRYDEKKLCRIVGICMAGIAVLILVMGLFEDILPAQSAIAAVVIVFAVCIAAIILINTVGKKR